MYHLHFHKSKQCSHAILFGYTIFSPLLQQNAYECKIIPFIQSTTWLVDHLLTGSMTRAIVEVFADVPNKGAKEALQHTQADICPFFTRCMFILPILLWFLRTKRWWSFTFKALLCIPSQWSL